MQTRPGLGGHCLRGSQLSHTSPVRSRGQLNRKVCEGERLVRFSQELLVFHTGSLRPERPSIRKVWVVGHPCILASMDWMLIIFLRKSLSLSFFGVHVLLSRVQLCDPMAHSPAGSSAHGLSRQEYWSGCHFPLQGILPTQGSNLRPLHWQADSLPLHHLWWFSR